MSLHQIRKRVRSKFAGKIAISGRRSGFALIELILVVIVLAILSSWYFQKGGAEQQAASTYQHSMDRSKATACLASRTALRSVVLTYTMQHPGEPVTTEALQKAGINLNVCPEKGQITVAPDGTLKCSIHQP